MIQPNYPHQPPDNEPLIYVILMIITWVSILIAFVFNN